MPHHFILTYQHILHDEETDEEPGSTDVLGYDDDDDEEEEEDMDPVEDELPGLLTDAQKDIEDVLPPNHSNGSAS